MNSTEYLQALIEGQEVSNAVPIKKAELKLLLKIMQQEEEKRTTTHEKEACYP